MAEKQAAMTEAVYYILLSLKIPNHGYGIIQNTADLTDGRLQLGAGTLYGALNTLLEKGWIRLYSADKHSRKKKQYVITEDGEFALRQELERLEELLVNGKRVLDQELAAEPEQKQERNETDVAVMPEGREKPDEEIQVVFR